MEAKDIATGNERIFNYKYYALHRCSTMVRGIIKEEMGIITFHDLVVEPIFDNFQNKEVETLMRHRDIGDQTEKTSFFTENVDQYILTKNYWEAFEHITGRRRKAVSRNTIAG